MSWRTAAIVCGMLIAPALPAATCSCAGVPLLASIDTAASIRGELSISYALEAHEISDLVSGSDDVPDETGRDRSSTSQVLSASYAMTDRWSLSALVSHVAHKRTIAASAFGGTTRTSGLGDSVVLVRYTPLYQTPFSRHELAFGAGARIATGDDNLRDGVSVVSEDMQPSIGADGALAWASYAYAFNQAGTLQLTSSASFIRNGENRRGYRFGDDLNVAVGLNHSPGPRWSYSVGLRYRHADGDQRSSFAIPNTGGEWLDFIPALQLRLNERFSFGVFGRVPIVRDLNGALQFTTSYAYGLTINYAR